VGHSGLVTQIVYRNNFYIRALSLDCPEEVAADTAEPINANAHGHWDGSLSGRKYACSCMSTAWVCVNRELIVLF
jgi:hypothetical protein